MAYLRQYAVSVICGGLICGILSGMAKGTAYEKLLRLVCGLFLTAVVLQPLPGLKIPAPELLTDSFLRQGRAAAEEGDALAREQLREIIKQQTQAYILERAEAMGARIRAEVTVSRSDPPVPEAVRIDGTPDPRLQEQLQQLLESELGIPKENQLWTGQNLSTGERHIS